MCPRDSGLKRAVRRGHAPGEKGSPQSLCASLVLAHLREHCPHTEAGRVVARGGAQDGLVTGRGEAVRRTGANRRIQGQEEET